MTELNISQIKTDGGTQARAGLNRQTVMQYRQIIRETDNGGNRVWPFADPLTVFHDGETYWLADGFHRLTACREQGRYMVDADIRQGTRRDAVLYAVGANATHGLQRTDEDKRRAVETLLRDEEWGSWSDREIARRARVSHPFVAKVRRELQDAGELEVDSSERTYTTRHGTTAVMNTQNIGGNGAGEQPEKPLYERLEQHIAFWAASGAPEKAGFKSGFAALRHIAGRGVGWKVPFDAIKNSVFGTGRLSHGHDYEDSDLLNVIMGMLERHGYTIPKFVVDDYVLVNTETRYLQPGRVTANGPGEQQVVVKIEENGGFTNLVFAEHELISTTESGYAERLREIEAAERHQPALPPAEPEKLYLKVWQLERWVRRWIDDIKGDDRQLSAMKSGRMSITSLIMYIEEGLITADGPRRHYRKGDIMQAINNVLEQMRQIERQPPAPNVRIKAATQIPSGTQSISSDATSDLAAIPHPFAAETTAERINLIIRMAEKIVAQSDDITVTLEMGTAVSHMYAAHKAARNAEEAHREPA